MKALEIRKKTEEELKKLKLSLKKDLEKLSRDLIEGKEKNVKKASLLRRDYARVMTVLKEKSLEKENKNE